MSLQNTNATRGIKGAVKRIPIVGPVLRSGWRACKRLFQPDRVGPVARFCGRLTPLEDMPNCPDLFHDYRRLAVEPGLKRVLGGWEYEGKFYPDYITVGGACHVIFPTALKYCRGHGADVGAGFWPLPGSTPIDLSRGPGAGKTLDDIPDASLDYLFSSHCLEHIDAWEPALRTWLGKLKPGGVVFLYLPHPTCGIWRPGSPVVGDGHKWAPTPEIVAEALARLGATVVARDDGPDAMYSFHVCARVGGGK